MERQLKQQDIAYEIRRKRRVKYPQIRMSVTGKFIVSVPTQCSQEYPHKFVLENLAWMKNQYAKFIAKQNDNFDSNTPTNIELRSIKKSLFVTYKHQAEFVLTSMHDQLGKQETVLKTTSTEKIKDALNTWLTKKAKLFLVNLVEQVSEETGLYANKISIRNQRTRWGSCSAKANISLNRNLMFLPDDLVRYLVIHELCHTKYMNHSGRYWRFVQTFEPNYHQLDKRLNKALTFIPLWALAD